MGVLSALICYAGNLKPFSYFDTTITETQNLDNVSPLYGPGPFYIWLIQVNTLMFDISTYDPNTPKSISPWFDKGRLIAILSYGMMAVLEQIIRAWLGDFSPAQAATRYIGDKAFESTAILFALKTWRDFLIRRRGILPQVEAPEKKRLYNYWLPIIFLLALALGRALEHHATTYEIPRESPQYRMTWNPLIPKPFRPVSLGMGVLYGILSTGGNLRNRCTEGFIKIVWMSNVLLHCGLFGTLGPLRLTNKHIKDREQLIPLVVSVLVVIWQYSRELVKMPRAALKRIENTYKWHSD
jgi:hypothetical protein